MKRITRSLVLVAALAALAGCGMFRNKDDAALKPVELTDIKPTIEVKRLWERNIGGDSKNLRVALRPAGDGNRIYTASRDGIVTAWEPESGREIWRTKLDTLLSAGPGVGEDLVAVAAADGYVIVLGAADGVERWRAYVAGESLARPLVRGTSVVAQTVDNRLLAFSTFNGSRKWTFEQSTPPLTLRGSASPVAVGTTVIAGFDNGRIVALDLNNGNVLWESLLSPPTGRSDLDRLADVDGEIAVVGQDVYAAGYQGRIASLAAESGQLLWARELSTYAGVSADWNNVYTVADDGVVIALSRRTGAEVWRQESLLRREPTVPVSFGTTVAVGDFEGWVHFFSNVDGDPAARVRVSKERITSQPVVVANRLYVQSDRGTVAAYVIPEPERPRRAPDIADEGE